MNFRLSLYCRTLKHVTLRQFYYYLLYWVRKHLSLSSVATSNPFGKGHFLILEPRPIVTDRCVDETNCFILLNKPVSFPDGAIDWNYSANGKLWTYHLNYFDFLQQPGLPDNFKFNLIHDYYSKRRQLKHGIEPYCISLRNINLIYYLSETRNTSVEFDELIGSHYLVLLRNVEYHLRANHLLENACSLVVGSFYFRNKQLYAKGSRLLVAQLNEQIFKDGGHYERSPMYHMIILHRLLDIVNVLLGNKIFDSQEDLLQILKVKTGRMLSWAKNMSCNNCLPAFHDSTNTEKVNIPLVEAYARRLKIEMPVISLEDSNYRKYKTNDLSLVMDIGSANPSFQPGHYHAGIFNFVLYVKDIPCIVDIGVSTYENNERRQYERSTMAHNTITINRVNQSEVWDSFRVGRRAKVYIEKDIKDSLMATHDGYDDIGKRHRITLNNLKDLISMKHELISTGNRYSVTTNEMRLHFHPTINPKLLHSGIVVDGLFSFEFVNASYVLENYSFAEDFNVLCEAKVLVITFVDWWELIIRS